VIKLAGCVITDKNDRILLLHRNNGKYMQWEIPGGKIDEDESAEAAAVREVKEELGVDVIIQKKIGEKEFTQADKTMHYVWFAAEIADGRPKIAEPEIFDNLAYHSVDEMKVIHDQLSPNTQNFLASLKEKQS
jgi:8-oxo-dGTP diphosphatase